MTTTTRFVSHADGSLVGPGEYDVVGTTVRVASVQRSNGTVIDQQHATITHEVAPIADSTTASGPTRAGALEQALAEVRTAFDACFIPDFNGVDWRDDKAVQALAARVYPILYRTTDKTQDGATS